MSLFKRIENGETTERDVAEVKKVIAGSYFYTLLIGIGIGICISFCLVVILLMKYL